MTEERPSADLSRLPQVDAVLQRDDAAASIERHGREPFTAAVRAVLDAIREDARQGTGDVPPVDEIVSRARDALTARRAGRLTQVVNATGVILHTNLGRAPLSPAARQAVLAATDYTTLEYDLAAGHRGSRTRHVGELAAEACGTEAATVVNNGAAALLLVLGALSAGRDAVVSRGELIEIGGSFRLPDIMGASGARMREVGTTNRTRAGDYRAVVSAETGMLLKVHPSNYRIEGFAETASAAELAAIARDMGVPFVFDLGSGLLRDEGGALAGEPSVASAIRDGADLVLFSGDKLLGGPQAGIVAGRLDLVARCATHPLARALRIDKLQRAALEATLEAHLRAAAPAELPVWSMLAADIDALERRAGELAQRIGGGAGAERSAALVGGGSLPGVELPSWCIALPTDDADGLSARLRAQDPPVIGRVGDGRVLLDLRTVPPEQDGQLADLVLAALG